MDANRLRGQVDALKGKPCNYGCHIGMRSTLEHDREEYNQGWQEVNHYLVNGDTKGRNVA